MQWFKHQKFMSDRYHKIAKRIIYYLSEQTQRAIDLRKKITDQPYQKKIINVWLACNFK